MSRSGYVDDCEPLDFGRWRGRVASAIRGKRGQKLLRDMRDALDAMPEKRLIAEDLINEGEVCALGCLGRHKGVPNLAEIDPHDHETLAKTFDAAECLIQEIEYENDEALVGRKEKTDEDRWLYVRRWVENLIQAPQIDAPRETA